MRSKIGIILMCTGAVLLAGALSLFAYNAYEGDRAEKAAQTVMSAILEAIEVPREPADAPEPAETAPPAVVELPDPTMTEVEIDGVLYIGYLSIPELGMDLPVQSDWSYRQLKRAPCRYSGSTKTDDLVLMAHNYKKHFKPIKSLDLGAQVLFTDMDGEVIVYQVVAIEVLPESAVEEMTAGLYDLSLFTCAYGGSATRYTVHCDRVRD